MVRAINFALRNPTRTNAKSNAMIATTTSNSVTVKPRESVLRKFIVDIAGQLAEKLQEAVDHENASNLGAKDPSQHCRRAVEIRTKSGTRRALNQPNQVWILQRIRFCGSVVITICNCSGLPECRSINPSKPTRRVSPHSWIWSSWRRWCARRRTRVDHPTLLVVCQSIRRIIFDNRAKSL